jgi:hypothetical protein
MLSFEGTHIALLLYSMTLKWMGEDFSPSDGVLFSGNAWPPIIVPTILIWSTLPILVAGAVSAIRVRNRRRFLFEPWFVAFVLLVDAFFAIEFARIFPDTPEWPRDSFWAGVILIVAAVPVGVLAVQRFAAGVVGLVRDQGEVRRARRGD